jgi:hypothetical protein
MRQLAILLLLACTACATRADAPADQHAAPAPAAAPVARVGAGATPAPSATLERIQVLVGKAECTSDSQCEVLPMGAKACGGPAGYLAFSNAKTNAAELQALAERYHGEQQASNQRSGMVSNCQVVPMPVAACRANTCQLTEALPAR